MISKNVSNINDIYKQKRMKIIYISYKNVWMLLAFGIEIGYKEIANLHSW